MILKCHDCKRILHINETFFDPLVAYKTWKKHGHFPTLATFICYCGQTHNTGPDANPDPIEKWAIDRAWYKQHKAHLTVN